MSRCLPGESSGKNFHDVLKHHVQKPELIKRKFINREQLIGLVAGAWERGEVGSLATS